MGSNPLLSVLSRVVRAARWQLSRYNLVRFERYALLQAEIADCIANADSQGWCVERAQAEEVDTLSHWGRSTRKDYVQRSRRGDVCFVAKDSDRVVGFVWLAFGRWETWDFEYAFDLNKAVWIYDGFTDPDYRRRGVHTALRHRALEWARQRGYERVYCDVYCGNVASMQAQKLFGFVECEQITYCRIGLVVYRKAKGIQHNGFMVRVGPLVMQTGPGRRGIYLAREPLRKTP